MTSSMSTPATQPVPPAPSAWPVKYQGPTLLPIVPAPATIPQIITWPPAATPDSRSL